MHASAQMEQPWCIFSFFIIYNKREPEEVSTKYIYPIKANLDLRESSLELVGLIFEFPKEILKMTAEYIQVIISGSCI